MVKPAGYISLSGRAGHPVLDEGAQRNYTRECSAIWGAAKKAFGPFRAATPLHICDFAGRRRGESLTYSLVLANTQ
jgi:hypothetical protein